MRFQEKPDSRQVPSEKGLDALEIMYFVRFLRSFLGEKGLSGDAMFARDQLSRPDFCYKSLVKSVSREKLGRSQTCCIMLLLCFW